MINSLESNGTYNIFCECDKNDFSWIYIPEEKFMAHRIIMTGNFSENNNSPIINSKRSTCVVEFSGYFAYEDVKKELNKLPFNLIPIETNFCKESYIINSFASRKVINSLDNKLKNYNIHICGRFAEWKYYNIDDCIMSAMNVCNNIII